MGTPAVLLESSEALACPFCGAQAQMEYWHGGKPSKRLVGCSGQGDTLFRRKKRITCQVTPSVTGETRAQALKRWNTRVPEIRMHKI